MIAARRGYPRIWRHYRHDRWRVDLGHRARNWIRHDRGCRLAEAAGVKGRQSTPHRRESRGAPRAFVTFLVAAAEVVATGIAEEQPLGVVAARAQFSTPALAEAAVTAEPVITDQSCAER